jgi:hypothetical protein
MVRSGSNAGECDVVHAGSTAILRAVRSSDLTSVQCRERPLRTGTIGERGLAPLSSATKGDCSCTSAKTST